MYIYIYACMYMYIYIYICIYVFRDLIWVLIGVIFKFRVAGGGFPV